VRSFHILIVASMLASTAAAAADYRSERRSRGYGHRPHVVYAAPPYLGIRQVPPTYYVNAPPHYVQDLRFGGPGYWVQTQPPLLDQLFGPRGYY
jgi:hypothetical protein